MESCTTPYANSIFEQPWWLEAVAPGLWEDIIFEENGEVVGRWPICFKDKSHKNIIMPPLTQTCGIWMKNIEAKNVNEGLERQKTIIDELNKKLNGIKTIDVSLDSCCTYFLPFYWKDFVINPRISYRIRNLNNLENVFENFCKDIKRNIRNAEKKISISEKVSADVMYSMLEKSFKVQGRKYPFSKDLIVRIINACEENSAGKMFTAIDKDGKIHSSSYFIYDQHRCYNLIAGSDPDYRSSKAQTLVLWEAIKFASKVSSEFDFEGSMVEGIETFFRRFGGEPIIYYHIAKQNLSQQMFSVLKPKIKRLIGYKI